MDHCGSGWRGGDSDFGEAATAAQQQQQVQKQMQKLMQRQKKATPSSKSEFKPPQFRNRIA